MSELADALHDLSRYVSHAADLATERGQLELLVDGLRSALQEAHDEIIDLQGRHERMAASLEAMRENLLKAIVKREAAVKIVRDIANSPNYADGKQMAICALKEVDLS